MSNEHPNPREIAIKGNKIYDRKYRAQFEERHQGRFAAIDVDTEDAYLADYPEKALAEAKRASPTGVFYLLRVGSSGAFKISRVAHAAQREL